MRYIDEDGREVDVVESGPDDLPVEKDGKQDDDA